MFGNLEFHQKLVNVQYCDSYSEGVPDVWTRWQEVIHQNSVEEMIHIHIQRVLATCTLAARKYRRLALDWSVFFFFFFHFGHHIIFILLSLLTPRFSISGNPSEWGENEARTRRPSIPWN